MPTSDASLLMDLSRSLVAVAVRSLGMIDGEVSLPQFRAQRSGLREAVPPLLGVLGDASAPGAEDALG